MTNQFGGIKKRTPSEKISAFTFGYAFLVIGTQRIGLPVGSESLPLPTLIGVLFSVAVLISQRWANLRGALIVLSFACTGLLALIIGGADAVPPRLSSLALLIMTLLPAVLIPRREGSVLGPPMLRGFLCACIAGAGAAVIQAVGQWVGVGFIDPLSLLPARWQISGYSTLFQVSDSNDLLNGTGRLGLGIKPNGMIFLEPSFLSLFCGLAFIVALHARVSPSALSIPAEKAALPAFALALALSISLSGVLVVAAGILVMNRSLWNARTIIGLSLLCGALFASNLMDGLISKMRGGVGTGTSAQLRLVLPYEEFPPHILERPIFGHGPGTAVSFADSLVVSGVQIPPLLRVSYEYGLLGLGGLIALLVLTVVGREVPAVLVASVFVAYLVPGEALLNASVSFLLISLLPHGLSRPRMLDGVNPRASAGPFWLGSGAAK